MLTVEQLIALCAQEANCPAYLTQGGQKLNLILQELSQDYDFSQNQGWFSGVFQAAPTTVSNSLTGSLDGNLTLTLTTNAILAGWRTGMSITDSAGSIAPNTTIGLISPNGLVITLSQPCSTSETGDTFTVTQGGIGEITNSANVVSISGPFQLPGDFLRMNFGDFFWQNGGINYFPTPLDINEFDALVQQPGFSSYPTAYSVDVSTTPNGLYIWPASSGAYPYFGRYERQMPDIENPSTSTGVPWFPSQQYLQRRLTAELMGITGDTRWAAYMKDAEDILNKYIKKEGNRDTRAAKVKLDPRHFGPSWEQLPGTKQVPW